jgi:hypothetical protein
MSKTNDVGGVMTFWGHLEELRGHLIRSASSIGIFALLAFLNKEFLFSKVILAPKETYFLPTAFFAAWPNGFRCRRYALTPIRCRSST